MREIPRSFRLPRRMRLSTRREFESVLRRGERRTAACISVVGRRNDVRHPRIGLKILRRHVRRSHDRNRMKRLVRESFRLSQHRLPCMDFVILSVRRSPLPDGRTLAEDVLRLLESYRR